MCHHRTIKEYIIQFKTSKNVNVICWYMKAKILITLTSLPLWNIPKMLIACNLAIPNLEAHEVPFALFVFLHLLIAFTNAMLIAIQIQVSPSNDITIYHFEFHPTFCTESKTTSVLGNSLTLIVAKLPTKFTKSI